MTERFHRNSWDSLKTQRTMSMTVDAWTKLGELADDSSYSRSEVLEVMIRAGYQECFDARSVKKDLLEGGAKVVGILT